MDEEDTLCYAVCDYFATGEGRTVSILIARPNFDKEDYEVQPSIGHDGEKWVYDPGKLKEGVTAETAIRRQFEELFGDYYVIGIEHLGRDEFIKRFKAWLPEFVIDLTKPVAEPTPDNWGVPPGFHFHTQLYYNFS